MTKNKVSIRTLKEFAFTQLPKGWPLRDVILGESEEVDVTTFLARLPVWLLLSKCMREETIQLQRTRGEKNVG